MVTLVVCTEIITTSLFCSKELTGLIRPGFFHSERLLRFNLVIDDMYCTGDRSALAQVLTDSDL